MRFVQDIPHPQFKIGVYAWNDKQIVKIEAGPYEQTYKINDFDIVVADGVHAMLDERFLASVARRFLEMDADWQETGERNDVL